MTEPESSERKTDKYINTRTSAHLLLARIAPEAEEHRARLVWFSQLRHHFEIRDEVKPIKIKLRIELL